LVIFEPLIYLPFPLIDALLKSLLTLGIAGSPRIAGSREPAAQAVLNQNRYRGIIEFFAEVN